MSIETKHSLLSKLEKCQRLADGAKTNGERIAALAAVDRIKKKIAREFPAPLFERAGRQARKTYEAAKRQAKKQKESPKPAKPEAPIPKDAWEIIQAACTALTMHKFARCLQILNALPAAWDYGSIPEASRKAAQGLRNRCERWAKNLHDRSFDHDPFPEGRTTEFVDEDLAPVQPRYRYRGYRASYARF